MAHRRLIFAMDFAAKKHTNQRRKNAESTPYIEHPLGVAKILTEAGIDDTEILEAAILHDVIEDTDCNWKELEENFCPETVAYVREVTDDKSFNRAHRKRLQVDHVRTASLGARLIKMADKIHNLESLFISLPLSWTIKRIMGYILWNKAVTDAAYNDHDPGYLPIILLHDRLNIVFSSKFQFDGKYYNCIPLNANLEQMLEEYYNDMK